MSARSIPTLAALVLLTLGQSAHGIIDDYSTGPGAGAPDQLDDVWQAIYNGWGLSPLGDEDHDGCSNQIECIAGSDPRNGTDCLKVGEMVIGASNIVFNIEAERGKRYQVWQSDSPVGAPPGAGWSLVAGAEKLADVNGADTIVFPRAAGVRKFYRMEAKDEDSDGDGVSDWAEHRMGTDPQSGTSPSNASGGTAGDLDTLRSLLSLTATPGVSTALEKEGTAATVRLQRAYGTMALTVNLDSAPGTTDPTKSNADSSDFVFKNMADATTHVVTLPAGAGVGTPYEVAKVSPLPDSHIEVPELLKVCVNLPGVPEGVPCPTAVVKISDADPAQPANRTLYVAFLGREAGIVSTASGYATALLDGDNTRASISVVFNNLSSLQNTAYIRIGPDLEVQVLPLGQVSGANWNIRAAQTEVTDQAMLNALKEGKVYVSITTENFPEKEIYGYFNKASGSETFDDTRAELTQPALGSATWQSPAGDALEREIWRFMSQATFGGTTALYQEIRAEVDAAIGNGGTYIDGLGAWLDKQMNPTLAPSLNYRQLVTAADMEEFALRGNKPVSFDNDPQLNGGSIGVSFVNGVPMASASNPNTNDPGNNYPRDGVNRRREWWTMITQSKDHLRQRVTQALSEICVISERDTTVLTWHYGAANWWDMLAAGAFGKYRTLLEQVSLNPMMGVYLTSVANRAAYDAGGGLIVSPDENYAREIMQLFSIGLVLRHPDGSLQLSSEGLPIATYDNNDITELARVFTGFSSGARHGIVRAHRETGTGGVGATDIRISPTVYLNGTTNHTWFGRNNDNGHLYWQAPWIYPMKVIGRLGTTVYHDYNPKTLLAGKHGELVIPAFSLTGKSDAEAHNRAAEEVSWAHDVLAGSAGAATYGNGTGANPGHTNTPVNLSRWLIQRLVTSNPSAGYIYRVQKVWRDTNGTLGPVIKAILLDYEARSLQLADTSVAYGKVKEPLIHFAAILRQFRAYSGAPVSLLRDMNLPFSDTDAPMSSYPADEHAKFNNDNLNPPSMPNGWSDGPFRFRLDSLRGNLGQSPLDAPSVFNWFYPDFTVPGAMAQAGLVAPEMQTVTEGAEIAKINFLYSYMWMPLAHMQTQPGTGTSVADFIFRNGWATPAVRFSTNGGSSFLGWPASITLNESNWNTGVTVTMVGVNNQQFSQMASTQVRYSVSGSAPGYGGIATQPTDIIFADNELKNEQLVITQTEGTTWVAEGGAGDTFQVRLSAPPADGSAVSVALAASNAEVTLSTTNLTFGALNWATPQLVSLTANDDSDAEDAGTGNDQITFVTTSASSANYNGVITAPLLINVVDNDNSYGVIIAEQGVSPGTNVAESGTGTSDTYTLVLTRQPSANVTVTIAANAQLRFNTTNGNNTTFSNASTAVTRVFTNANWNVPQTVTVIGNNDSTSEGNHTSTITHTVSATGGYSSTLPIQSIVANIVDDDNGIIVAHSGEETRVAEGGMTDTLTVRLRSNPTAPVSVTLSSAELKFSPATLIFVPTGSSGNLWSVDQTITVTANDDYLNEGLHTSSITSFAQSTGTLNGATGGNALPVTIIDNDDARLVLTQSEGSTAVNENGDSDTYALSLGRRPATGTTVTVTASGFSGITLTPPGPFVFDETNWNTPQVVLVTASNDATSEPIGVTNITHTVVSTDPVYNASSSPVLSVTVSDNDPALTIVQSNIFTQVREGGGGANTGTPNASDTFTVAPARSLATGATVTVTLVPSGQVTVSPSVLTFTNTTAQTVTVTAVNDGDAEATVHQGVVGFNVASTDSYYNGAFAPPVLVQVTDDDSIGVSIVESGGTTGTNEGSTTQDSYTVVLTKQPSANVDIAVNGGTQTLLSKSGTPNLSGVTLNFTPTNWDTAQTVNVLPVNDTAPELRHLAPIMHTVSGAAEYAALSPLPDVQHLITDNDTTGSTYRVRITESGGFTSVTEASTTDTLTVVLSQQPTSPVTVNLSSDAQMAVNPSVVTFTAADWNTAKTVTVRAVDDNVIESILHWGFITVTASSADPAFTGLSIPTVVSSVYDNDGACVNIVPTGGSTVLTENGQTDSYSIALSHEPTSDVTIAISPVETPTGQTAAGVSSITFTPTGGSNPWNVPQVITLTAVNDATAEAASHVGLVRHVVSSADPFFHNASAANLSATIYDKDSPGLEVSHTDGGTTVTEGGASDSIVVRLNQAPAPGTSVTVTLYPPAYYVPPPQLGKSNGYFVNDQGGSNQRDNIVIDYTESIQKYRDTFYATLRAAHGGTIPTTPTPATIRNAHWAASRAVIDQMDLWFSGGGLKAKHPILIEPNQPPPSPLPPRNPRQAIIEAIYAHSGGSGLTATTRYEAEIPFNPKAPSTTTFANDVRDRVRWAGYLMTVGAPGLVSH